MIHKVPDFQNGIRIESVGTYLEEIRKLHEDRSGESTKLFFRGQETEFWKVEPSIFRGDMLSVEHELMLTPLQKIPMEFRNMQDTFEIMTKYQHYGMCTRLLDLTTNPLVALYFACKKHGREDYENDENGEPHNKMEPFGMVFFSEGYSVLSDDLGVKIVTFLAKNNLEKENLIQTVLDNLVIEKIIAEDIRNFWMSEDNIDEFIELIQRNYLVMPLYSNVRLEKQSGAFLLPGLFGFTRGDELPKSIITKCKKDLREEFDKIYFYVDGNDKDAILEELDWYNINESTLFPELEHQLNYIKQSKWTNTKSVAEFEKYSNIVEEKQQKIILAIPEERMGIYKENIKQFIFNIIGSETGELVFNKLLDNMVVDWYKRDSVKSKMRITIATLLGDSIENPKNIATDIVKYIVQEYTKIAINP